MIITEEEYKKKVFKYADKEIYWKKESISWRRWEYFSKVIEELHKIPNERVLEIGVFNMALTTHSDILDLTSCDTAKKMYKQDAGKTPWEFAGDKSYDVVIANQVFEHLNGNQKKAWDEVERIADYAIITIPYMWNCPHVPDHHQIGENHIKKWFHKGNCYYREYINERELLCYKF